MAVSSRDLEIDADKYLSKADQYSFAYSVRSDTLSPIKPMAHLIDFSYFWLGDYNIWK